MTNFIVPAGGTSSGLVVSYGANLLVQSGGTASSITVQSGGVEVIAAGGSAVSTTIQPGGTLSLQGLTYVPGGSATLTAGDVLTVYEGGSSNTLQLAGSYAGDTIVVASNGAGTDVWVLQTVSSSTVPAGQVLILNTGSATSGVTLFGSETVTNSAAAVSTTVSSGGVLGVFGVASSTMVKAGGLVSAYNYGFVSATVSSGGALVVENSYPAAFLDIKSGGALLIGGGNRLSASQVESGGLLVELGGQGVGISSTLTIAAGATVVSTGEAVFRRATGVVVSAAPANGLQLSSGAQEWVLSNGIDSGAVLGYGASQTIERGGSAVSALVSGGYELVSAGGTAIGTTVSAYGQIYLYEGAAASGLRVASAGTAYVFTGASLTSTTLLPGGTIDLAALAFASGGTAAIDGNGLLTVSEGGVTSTLQLAGSYGGEIVLLTGDYYAGTRVMVVSSAPVSSAGSGQIATLSAGSLGSGWTAGSGGTVAVSGTMSALVVQSGGFASVSYPGVATSTQVQGGGVLLAQNTTSAVATQVQSGGELVVQYYASAIGTVISAGGAALLTTNAYGTGTDVKSGGALIVSGANSVVSTHVESGGLLLASPGVVVNGLNGNVIDSGAVLVSGGVFTFQPGVGAQDVAQTSGLVLSSGGLLEILSGGVASGTTLLSGASATEFAGGTMVGGVVRSGASNTVSSGGVISAVTASGGGISVLAGGRAIGTTLISAGLYVQSGAATTGTMITSYTAELVYAGASAVSGVVSAYGTQIVSSGGVASGTSVASYGSQTVYSGATVVSTTIAAGGTLDFANLAYVSGGTAVLGAGDVLSLTVGAVTSTLQLAGDYTADTFRVTADFNSGSFVLVNGPITPPPVTSGQTLVVSSGVTFSAAVINGGLLLVSSGGTDLSATVSAGGRLQVSAGGVESGTTVLSGGLERISSGGVAGGIVVSNGGDLRVSSASVVSGVDVKSGGSLAVFSGTTISGVHVESGGLLIETDGLADGATVVAGATIDAGALVVSAGLVTSQTGAGWGISGLSATSISVSSGFDWLLNSGVIGSATLTGSGTYLAVDPGAVVSGVSVSNGATILAAGGTVSGGTVSSGGAASAYFGGVIDNLIVSSGGLVYVSSGAVISGLVLNSGASAFVSSGGRLVGAVLSGGYLNGVAATLVDTQFFTGSITLSGGGTDVGMVLYSGRNFSQTGGVLASPTIENGGSVTAQGSGTVLSALALSGGTIRANGGTVTSATVQSGAALLIYGGGAISGGTIQAGGLEVFLHGGPNVSPVTAISGLAVDPAAIIVSSGVLTFDPALGYSVAPVLTSGAILGNGANQRILNNGTVLAAQVLSGGNQNVFDGGWASGTRVSSGGFLSVLNSGATSNAVVLSGGNLSVSSGGFASANSVGSGGLQYVYVGGSVAGTVVSSGGSAFINSGGYDSGAVILQGGTQTVTTGITVGDVLSGGTENVYTGATASATIVSSGGLLLVDSATTQNVVVSSGGVETSWYGATVYGTTVKSGGELRLSNGGLASGVALQAGGIIDFASLAYVAGGSASLSGSVLTVSEGGTSQSVTVSGLSAGATFSLASDGIGGTALVLAAPPSIVISGISPDTGVSSSDAVTSAEAVMVSGAGQAGAIYHLAVDGFVLSTGTIGAGGSWLADLSGFALGNGVRVLTATETDATGTLLATSSPFNVTIAADAYVITTPLATPGGDYFIGTAADLLAASRPIAGPAGLFNTLVIQGDGTLTDAAFAGISHVTGLTLNGTGAASLTLGANASAMAGGFIAVSVPNAASYTINDGGAGAPPLYLLGGSGNAIVTGSNSGDYLVFNGGTLNVTEGAGDDFINIAANQLNLPGTVINGGGGTNRLVMAGANTITDSSFAGLSNIQELDFSGTGAQSVILAGNAHAAFGSALKIYTATASSLTIDASALQGVGLTVDDVGTGSDTLIAGTGGSYLVGGSGADLFKVGLGGTNYIADFVPGVDKITLQAGGFASFAQVTSATAQYGASGFDIAIGNGAHVVVLGVAFTSMHAADFGLSA